MEPDHPLVLHDWCAEPDVHEVLHDCKKPDLLLVHPGCLEPDHPLVLHDWCAEPDLHEVLHDCKKPELLLVLQDCIKVALEAVDSPASGSPILVVAHEEPLVPAV